MKPKKKIPNPGDNYLKKFFLTLALFFKMIGSYRVTLDFLKLTV